MVNVYASTVPLKASSTGWATSQSPPSIRYSTESMGLMLSLAVPVNVGVLSSVGSGVKASMLTLGDTVSTAGFTVTSTVASAVSPNESVTVQATM